MRTTKFSIPSALMLMVLALTAGCSSFHRDWKAATRQPLPAQDLSGPWEGRWVSDVNGHNDRLRCLITPAPGGGYDARFHAKYRRVLSFSYSVPLQARREGDAFMFSGQADLGKLAGGVYTYEGTSTGGRFTSNYRSKHDHGRFEMTRPATQE